MELHVNDFEETDALREALATCFYHASDEERALRDKLALGGLDENERRVTEHGMTEAARRRMRYSLLHDRVLNLIATMNSAEVIQFPAQPADYRPLVRNQE